MQSASKGTGLFCYSGFALKKMRAFSLGVLSP